MMNKSKLKIIAGVVFIFVLGSLSGVLGGRLFYQHRLKEFIKGPEAFFLPKFMRQVERKLDLSSEQREKVKIIVSSLKDKLGEFRRAHEPELREIVKSHIDQIKKELHPEQQKKLDRMIKRIEKRMKHRFRKHKKSPPGGPGEHGRPDFDRKRRGFTLFRLKDKLNLSEEQIKKISPLFETRRRQKMEMERNLEQILTPEQLKEYQKFWKKRF